MVPADDIAQVVGAQQRFNDAIAGLADADVRRPTLCAGWTVGHLLTHVARNADSHVRRTEAAMRGETVEQYTGGYEGRAVEIDEGATRSAAELIADVRDSGAAVERAWSRVIGEAWENPTLDVRGREMPLHQLVGWRWQELEVHLIDLDLGVTYRDWPEAFVRVWLPRVRTSVGEIAHAGSGLDDREQLAWLYGRRSRPDVPAVPAFG